jgi:hypothetical protein
VKKRRGAAVAAMVSTVCAAGCSLFIDTAGLEGELPPDASGDVQSERASSEGGDTSAPLDAGKVCDATFCDDFDDGGLGARWTSKAVDNGGVLELGTPARSTPNALRARFTTTTTAPGDRNALLERDLGAGTRLRCDFWMFVESPPTDGTFVDIFRVRTTAPGVDEYNLFFGVNGGPGASFREDLFLTDGGCPCPRREASPPTFPLSRWVEVTVETDFATASLAYDGHVVAAGPFALFKPSSNVFVAVGTRAYGQQPSVVLFDDLSCTLAP